MRLAARLAELHPKRFFLDTWRALDAEAETARAARRAAGKGWDWRPLAALGIGGLCLTLIQYGGFYPGYEAFLRLAAETELLRPLADAAQAPDWRELWAQGWWTLIRFIAYFVIPALVIVALFGEPVRAYGLETKALVEHAWVYVFGYAIVFACILFVAAFVPHFTEYYPFYRDAGRSWLDFGLWQSFYVLQFFALEFFFRGFWLNALRQAMGSAAIFAMTIPYCMIHFGKPLLETLAAIVAGIFLGTLAMKTRSIWAGFLLHASVAITMDLAAMIVTGRWPDRLLP